MKKIFLFTIISTLLLFPACVYDSMFCISIINRTNDTILIGVAPCNNIDSVKAGISTDWFFELKFDETGKLIFDKNNDIIRPDHIGKYCEPGGFRNKSLFVFNYEKKGYFFIINLETIENYTWEEICRNKLYKTMIVTREMLKNNDWKIDYSW